jgi:hypothetical protein
MEKGLGYEPPRRVTSIEELPPLAVREPVLALGVDVPLVAVLLGVEVPGTPAWGEPAAAWVWWCSGPEGAVAAAVPVWAVSFISAVSVGMIILLSPVLTARTAP